MNVRTSSWSLRPWLSGGDASVNPPVAAPHCRFNHSICNAELDIQAQSRASKEAQLLPCLSHSLESRISFITVIPSPSPSTHHGSSIQRFRSPPEADQPRRQASRTVLYLTTCISSSRSTRGQESPPQVTRSSHRRSKDLAKRKGTQRSSKGLSTTL